MGFLKHIPIVFLILVLIKYTYVCIDALKIWDVINSNLNNYFHGKLNELPTYCCLGWFFFNIILIIVCLFYNIKHVVNSQIRVSARYFM